MRARLRYMHLEQLFECMHLRVKIALGSEVGFQHSMNKDFRNLDDRSGSQSRTPNTPGPGYLRGKASCLITSTLEVPRRACGADDPVRGRPPFARLRTTTLPAGGTSHSSARFFLCGCWFQLSSSTTTAMGSSVRWVATG